MEGSARALGLALAVMGAATACARLPVPFTAAQLAEASEQMPPGKVLVHYLSQPDADPEVCDLRSASPHLARVDDGAMRDLVEALVAGRVPAPAFLHCASLLWAEASEPTARSLVVAAVDAIEDRLRAVDLDDAVAVRVDALHRLFAEQQPGEGLPFPVSATLLRLVERLQAMREKGDLGPRGREMAAAIVETVEIDLGRFRGAQVTNELIASMSDEPVLARLAARLPFEELRQSARRRLVRLHIEASRFPEVRERAQQVERAVMESGRNAIVPQGATLRRSWIESETARHGVLVRQDVLRQRSSLLSFVADEPGSAVLPTLDLKGLLMFDVDGASWPLTLCAPAAKLAVEPCLDAGALSLDNPVSRLDDDGVVHFLDGVPLSIASELAQKGRSFTLQTTLSQRALAPLTLPLWFERPADVVLTGGPGLPGPYLQVDVEARAGRVVFSTRAGAAREDLLAVVERRDLPEFHLVTRGGAGATGSAGYTGTNGAPGYSGTPAMCPSTPGGRGGDGQPGGAGGPGGPGGRGGDGGEADVALRCAADADCSEIAGLLRSAIVSQGGAGGAGGQGGSGGQGGAGGAGGSGTSCYNNGQYSSASGGASGSPGANGPSGSSGAPGQPGVAGTVKVRVVR